MSRRLAALGALMAGLMVPVAAVAEPMDPALERLVTNPECKNEAGAFLGTGDPSFRCLPDSVAFRQLMAQYGFAFAPSAMHSARTTGFGGFHFSIEGAYTKIDSGADYWRRGTRGPIDPTTNQASVINDSPQSLLQLYSIKVRKSYGFGFEVAGAVGFMPKTSILSGGADVRLSLFEGFREGIPGYIPDIAVGGGVRTITGTPQFQLTVVGVDAQVSKPIPVHGASVLTPWVGFQYLWTFGDSGLIDLTPGTDAIQLCDYQGDDLPGVSDPNGGGFSGQPVCRGGSPNDFNNDTVFTPAARIERQRLLFGLSYKYEMVMTGAQFIVDMVEPASAQNSDEDSEALEGMPRQWTLVLEAGVMF